MAKRVKKAARRHDAEEDEAGEILRRLRDDAWRAGAADMTLDVINDVIGKARGARA